MQSHGIMQCSPAMHAVAFNQYKVFMYLFLQVVKGTHLLFLYAEYVGDDFDGDMDRLSLEPRDIEWHKICDPCQVR